MLGLVQQDCRIVYVDFGDLDRSLASGPALKISRHRTRPSHRVDYEIGRQGLETITPNFDALDPAIRLIHHQSAKATPLTDHHIAVLEQSRADHMLQ